MAPILRVILVVLLAAILTVLIAGADLIHGLLVLLFAALLTYNLWRFYRWSNINAAVWSCLLTLVLVDGSTAITIVDASVLITTIFLTLTLARPVYYLYWDGMTDWWESLTLVAVVVTPGLVLLWLIFRPDPLPLTGHITASNQQFNRIVQAIGEQQQAQARLELEGRFGPPGSSTWEYGLGSNIHERGPWPLYLFFPEFVDDGADLALGLWGNKIDELRIADINTSPALQPLLTCRNAIRALFDNMPLYTPFFQFDDFNGANNPYERLVDRVYEWTVAHMQTTSISNERCRTKPDQTDTIIEWVMLCTEPAAISKSTDGGVGHPHISIGGVGSPHISIGGVGSPHISIGGVGSPHISIGGVGSPHISIELQKIKTFAMACEAVQFIAP